MHHPFQPPLSRMTSTRGTQGPRAPAARDRPPGPWRRRRGGCWLRQQSRFGRRTQGRSGSWPSPSAWPCCRDATPIEVEAGEQPLIHVHWAVLPTLTLRPNCTVAVLPARLSQGLGVPVPRGLSSSTQNHEEGARAKQWMRNKWQPSGGRGPWVPSGTEPSVHALQPSMVGQGLIRMAAKAAQLWNTCHWKPNLCWGQKYSHSGELSTSLLFPCSRLSLFK